MIMHSQRNEPIAFWQAGEIPPACTMIPTDAEELERLRLRQAGRPR
jgi:hypothetical protein